MATKRKLGSKGLSGVLKRVPGQPAKPPSWNGKPFGFTPWDPAQKPPSGTYDPTLDANLRGAQRGFGDLTDDKQRDDTRALNDYGIAQHQIRGSLQQALNDVFTSRTRAQENYATATQGLQRQYTQQGQAQAQGAQAAGVVGGGALAQALLKRTQNQAIDQKGLDTQQQRTLSDLMQSEDRAKYAANDQQAALKLGFDRGVEDRSTTFQRAGRELTSFGTDTAEQRAFQAGQTGWVNQSPANEFRSAKGTPYRVLMSKDWLVGPGGKRTRKIYMTADGTRSLTRPA